MYMRYKSLFFMLFLGLFQANYTYIYEVKVLRKWDAGRQKYHYFIGLSDFHDKHSGSNQSQLSKIEQLLANLDKNRVKIAVEDLSSPNAQGRQECGHFSINSRGGILGGLAEKCKNLGFEVDNVEFRYCRVSSLGPILNNLKERLDNFPSATHTHIAALVQEINQEIQAIDRYSDGHALSSVYNASIKEVAALVQSLHLEHDQSKSVAHYVGQHSKDNTRLELLKKLLTFDSSLLDIKLVHSVMQAGDKDRVIAIAGGAHIARVSELLIAQGYAPMESTKITFAREHDLNKCLGSHIIEGAFCMKPEAIDLGILQKAIETK